MGKILESIGIIDGYEIISIGKIRAKKDELFEQIKQKDEKIQEEVQRIVEEDNGEVIAIVKEKEIKGIYLFEIEKSKEEQNLKHKKTVYLDEVSEETREKYNDFILKIATDYVKDLQYKKVTLEDKVVQLDPKQSAAKRALALLCGFMLGFALGWLVFEDVMLGAVYGILFAPLFSNLEVLVTNKRGRKKKGDNK